MLNGVFARELDPTQVYYELIGRTWPMNALAATELDEVVTVDRVERAWNRLADQVPVIGAHVERTSGRDARMVFGTSRGPLPVTRHDDVPSAWAHESQTAIDPQNGPMVRCSVVERRSGATIILASHHSALDGRALAELSMLLAGVLVEDADISGHPLAEPTLPLRRAAGQDRLADMVATARQVREEDGFVGSAAAFDWHEALLDPPRDVSFALFDLSEEETSGVLAWARSQQTTVQGALSAALLRAAASVPPGMERIGLSTTVDLRARFDAPERGQVGQAAGVISASYDTTGATGDLARQVSADVRRRFDRGEAEMLIGLSGAGRFPVDHTADGVIRRWTEQATPTLCIGNLGRVAGPAPRAMQRLNVAFAPTPNQVAFFSATTFRGRLNLAVGYDRNRLTIDPDTFASTIHSHVLELGSTREPAATSR